MKQECNVCAEVKSAAQFPTAPIAAKCAHSPSTCLACVTFALKTDLSNKPWAKIGCPECGVSLEYQDVQRYADAETRAKYDGWMALQAMEREPGFIWCSSGCGSGQIHDGGEAEPIVKCSSCGHLTCFQHKAAWHRGITCEEFDLAKDGDGLDSSASRVERASKTPEQEAEMRRRREEDDASAKTIQTTTKPCPECKSQIEKNGGCSHMTCSRCMYQFCWECFADFKKIVETDNSGHEESCKFHTDNLPE